MIIPSGEAPVLGDLIRGRIGDFTGISTTAGELAGTAGRFGQNQAATSSILPGPNPGALRLAQKPTPPVWRSRGPRLKAVQAHCAVVDGISAWAGRTTSTEAPCARHQGLVWRRASIILLALGVVGSAVARGGQLNNFTGLLEPRQPVLISVPVLAHLKGGPAEALSGSSRPIYLDTGRTEPAGLGPDGAGHGYPGPLRTLLVHRPDCRADRPAAALGRIFWAVRVVLKGLPAFDPRRQFV